MALGRHEGSAMGLEMYSRSRMPIPLGMVPSYMLLVGRTLEARITALPSTTLALPIVVCYGPGY